MLTTQNWERRLRRKLSKYGLRLSKGRGRGDWYTVLCDGEAVYSTSSLLRLQGFAEDLAERQAG